MVFLIQSQEDYFSSYETGQSVGGVKKTKKKKTKKKKKKLAASKAFSIPPAKLSEADALPTIIVYK